MSSVVSVLSEAARASDDYRPGIWVGRVEDLKDPKRSNRIRVRIFMIHGDASQTPTEALPWAEVVDFAGGGYDFGSAGLLYPVGSTVWVMFEMCHDNYPVVIGGRRGSIARDADNPQEMLTLNGKSEIGEARWNPPEANELPLDIFQEDPEAKQPTRTIWAKSFKGHTILVENADAKEFLRIIDRAGQVIELSSPVTKTANEDNAQQRGTKNAIDGTQLAQDKFVDSRTTIRIIDAAGQELLLDTKADEEKITLTSRKRGGSTTRSITLSSKNGEERVIADVEGNVVLITKDKIELGEENAGDKVPLDSLVQDEFKARVDDHKKTVQEASDHVHPLAMFIPPLIPLPGPPAPTLPGTTPGPPSMKPTMPFTDPKDPKDTASALVTIKE